MIYDYTEWGPRFVPGTAIEGGREFMYIETASKKDFFDFLVRLAPACKGIPKDGGALGERAIVQIPSGKLLHALSYNKDLAGWRSCITAFCEKTGIVWGKIEDDYIVLTNGESAALKECKIEMW